MDSEDNTSKAPDTARNVPKCSVCGDFFEDLCTPTEEGHETINYYNFTLRLTAQHQMSAAERNCHSCLFFTKILGTLGISRTTFGPCEQKTVEFVNDLALDIYSHYLPDNRLVAELRFNSSGTNRIIEIVFVPEQLGETAIPHTTCMFPINLAQKLTYHLAFSLSNHIANMVADLRWHRLSQRCNANPVMACRMLAEPPGLSPSIIDRITYPSITYN
jgi:hypothetical protein